jgi:hypothetical protein
MMKSLVALLLFSPAAFAGVRINLTPPPSPYPNSPFGTQCFLDAFDSVDGVWTGTCQYGNGNPHNGLKPAMVTWSTTGAPLTAVVCYAYAYEGSPVCPAKTYGKYGRYDGYEGYLQGVDQPDDVDGVMISGTTPALLTP